MNAENEIMLCVSAEDAGMRLDAYVSAHTELSRNAAVRMTESGDITVNGEVRAKKYTVKCSDTVQVRVKAPTDTAVQAQDIELNIVYEDDDLLVIDKPVGMVVHPAPGHESGTLVNALLAHCRGSLSGIGGELRPGIVHRIDKDTGGLLVVAKNDRTHRALSSQLERHDVVREYRALVCGGFSEDGGTVDAPIGRHPKDRKRMAVIRDGSSACRHAVTHWSVENRYGPYTELSLILETGRTHQIRVHMSSIGHPLMGDTVYGGGKTQFEKVHSRLFRGQCLYAVKLSFTHPSTGEQVRFSCPLPDEYTRICRILESTYCAK